MKQTKNVRDKEKQILNFFKNVVHPTILLSEYNDVPEPEYLVSFGLNFMHRVDFIDFIIRFGLNFDSVDTIYQHLCTKYPESYGSAFKPLLADFKKYLKEFYAILLMCS